MTNQKPKCPPCHGNCNQGRTCPNKAAPIEEEFQVTFADFVVTLACIAFVVVCLALLFFGEHAQ